MKAKLSQARDAAAVAAETAAPVVVLTRTIGDNAPLRACAERLGAAVVDLPCLATVPVTEDASHAQLPAHLAAAEGVLLASRRGAEGFAALLTRQHLQLPARCALLAVGPATAAAAERALQRFCVMPPVHNAEGLLALALAQFPRPATLLLPAAADGRPLLADGLAARGHRSIRLVIYRTVPAAPRAPRMTWDQRLHYIVGASPSAVAGFFAQAHWPARGRALSIGPATSAAFAAHGVAVAGQASSHDAPGLARLLEKTLAATGKESNTQ